MIMGGLLSITLRKASGIGKNQDFRESPLFLHQQHHLVLCVQDPATACVTRPDLAIKGLIMMNLSEPKVEGVHEDIRGEDGTQ